MISKLLILGSLALCADRNLAYRTNIDNEHSFFLGEVRGAIKKTQRIKSEALFVVRHTSEIPRGAPTSILFFTVIFLHNLIAWR